jgi:hypothetical protein
MISEFLIKLKKNLNKHCTYLLILASKLCCEFYIAEFKNRANYNNNR